MTKDEALRMALEALEADELDMVDDGSGNMVFRKEQAITAIKKSLAQPEQEPVAWINKDGDVLSASVVNGKSLRNIPLYTIPPQIKCCAECGVNDNNHALYCVACAEKYLEDKNTKGQK